MAADVLHIEFGVPYVVSTGFFAVVLAAVTPWLVVKRPLPKRPDLRPSGLWLGLLLLVAIANARSGASWTAGVGVVVALVGGLVAARNARTVNFRVDARPPARA